ncbi:MAG: hypothetical protein ABI459_12615 [Deltaproteobacteria bacterium]
MRIGIVVVVAIIVAVTAFWWAGGPYWVASWALAQQRDLQTALAHAINALRDSHPGALCALLAVCFGYGFFHAVGPGHGKMLIASYGVAGRVPLLRLLAVALASSLGQAVSAIVIVYGALALFGWGRQELTDFGDLTLARFSAVMLGLIGLWLVWRGVKHLRRVMRRPDHHHDHHHDHDHHHAHLPDAETLSRLVSPREILAMIGAIAVRPCTGALLLLLLTWRFGLVMAGILGTVAMALGTASVVLAVALFAGGAGRSVLLAFDGKVARVAVPVVELLAGAAMLGAAAIAYQAIRPF